MAAQGSYELECVKERIKRKSISSLKGRELEKDIRKTMSDRTVWNTRLNKELCACFSESVLLFGPIVVTTKKNTQLT